MTKSQAFFAAIAAVAIVALPAAAQVNEMEHTDPVTSIGRLQDQFMGWVVMAAEQVSEADYAFQPTSAVRTMGQIFGHLANENYLMCSVSGNTANPSEGVDFEKASRSEIIAGLKGAQAFCTKTAEWAKAHHHDPVELFGMKGDVTWLVALTATHNAEHYGNIVTYMRIKGMVPPSSQGG